MIELEIFSVALNNAAALAEQRLAVITGPVSFVITVALLAARELHGSVMPMPLSHPWGHFWGLLWDACRKFNCVHC